MINKKKIAIILAIVLGVLGILAGTLIYLKKSGVKFNISLPASCSLLNENANIAGKNPASETEEQKKRDEKEYADTNVVNDGKHIPLENAANGKYKRFQKGILSATDTTLTLYDQDGNSEWSEKIQIASPILEVAGEHIIVYEQNGKVLTVYNKNQHKYSKTISGNIKTASISESGDVAVVFEREGYKGSVIVYNKEGQEVYLWNSGKFRIIDADISPSRRLAVTLLNTNNTLEAKIYYFDLAKSGPESTISIDDTVVFDIDFDGDVLNAYCDNKVIATDIKGDIKWNYDFGGRNITRYIMTEKGEKVISFDNHNVSEITMISRTGDEKNTIKTDILPDCLDCYDDRILFNSGRTLVVCNQSGEIVARYTASRDVKSAYLMSSKKIFIVYTTGIEFLDI
ncbi:MAG: DUF5711 family protein [Clostridia bacterium]|nr:DUF5711 family protein [Clostridia bacterium]